MEQTIEVLKKIKQILIDTNANCVNELSNHQLLTISNIISNNLKVDFEYYVDGTMCMYDSENIIQVWSIENDNWERSPIIKNIYIDEYESDVTIELLDEVIYSLSHTN